MTAVETSSLQAAGEGKSRRPRVPFLLRGLFVFLLLILVVYWSGPTVEVDETLHPIDLKTLAADPEGYLAASEIEVENLNPKLAKRIHWAHDDHRKTKYALVYMHGFSTSCQDCMPVPELVAEHLNANAFYSRLTAHGLAGEERGEGFCFVKANDWLNDVHEAVTVGKQLGDEVILIGFSTGGTLSLWMANREPDVAALILLSPNFGIAAQGTEVALWPWGKEIVRLVEGTHHEIPPEKIKNERQQEAWTPRYRSEGIAEMLALVDHCCRQDYSDFDKPCLCVYSEHDDVIDLAEMRRQFQQIGSEACPKKLCEFPKAKNHVLGGDILYAEGESRKVTSELVKLITEYLDEELSP